MINDDSKMKSPWQVTILQISYLIGIASVCRFMYYQVLYQKSVLQIIGLCGLPILLFIVLLVLSFISRPMAYFLSIISLVPIYIMGSIYMLVLIFIPSIWTIINPIVGIAIPFFIFCSPTRIYFKVKRLKEITKE